MKKITFLIIIAALANTVHAQITFQKTYGEALYESGYSVQQTSGGYVVTGTIGGQAIYLIKTDFDGNLIWTKSYWGIQSSYQDFTGDKTSDGGFIIVCDTYSDSTESNDVYLLKTDSNGNLLWSYTYGTTDAEYGLDVLQTDDRGYMVVGYTYFGSSVSEVYVFKTDSLGILLWTKSFVKPDFGFPDSKGVAISQTTYGGYIIAGTTISSGQYDLLILKIDDSGNLLWSKTYDTGGDEEAVSIQQTHDAGFVLASLRSVNSSYLDVDLLKIDSSGNLLWSTRFDRTQHDDWAASARETMDGGYILAASTFENWGYDVYIIRTDASGNLLWSKQFGGDDNWCEDIEPTNDGGFIITGYRSESGGNVYLIKTDSLGNTGCDESDAETTQLLTSVIVSETGLTVSSNGTSYFYETLADSGGTETVLCLATEATEVPIKEMPFSVFPNPFSNSSTVSFSLPQSENVSLKIFDLQGRLIRTLADEVMNEGAHTLTLDARYENGNAVNAGIYLLKLQTANEIETVRLSVVK